MGSAGSWTAVSPTGLVWGVGGGGGTGRVASSSVWQTHRRTELGERPGTGSGDDSGGGILLEKWLASRSRPGHSSHRQRGEITQSDALRHTPVEERTGGRLGRGGRGERERAHPEKPPLSPGSFQVNVGVGRMAWGGALRGVV